MKIVLEIEDANDPKCWKEAFAIAGLTSGAEFTNQIRLELSPNKLPVIHEDFDPKLDPGYGLTHTMGGTADPKFLEGLPASWRHEVAPLIASRTHDQDPLGQIARNTEALRRHNPTVRLSDKPPEVGPPCEQCGSTTPSTHYMSCPVLKDFMEQLEQPPFLCDNRCMECGATPGAVHGTGCPHPEQLRKFFGDREWGHVHEGPHTGGVMKPSILSSFDYTLPLIHKDFSFLPKSLPPVEVHPDDQPKQETWRDRPPML